MPLYLAHSPDEHDLFATESPRPGARLRFSPQRLAAARGGAARPHADDTDGLVVRADPLTVLRWPCRLWLVSAPDVAWRSGRGATWLRCRSVTIEQELPAWLVMGPHGEAVAGIVERARTLTGPEVRSVPGDDGREARAVDAALARWRGRGRAGSPIGVGLGAVDASVTEAARQDGGDLFAWDDDDGLEVLTDPHWRGARAAAMSAALAAGAPGLFDGDAAEEATLRWRLLTGPSPTSGG